MCFERFHIEDAVSHPYFVSEISPSVVDGSSGGFLNDAWMLRLSNFSTDGVRYAQQRYLDQHCRWRTGQSAVHSLTLEGTESCVRGGSNAPCELRNLLLLPWCDQNNQTVI